MWIYFFLEFFFLKKMSNNPILYYTFDLSPPSRAVLLTAKALNIDLDLRNINLMKGEQLSREFLEVFSFSCVRIDIA